MNERVWVHRGSSQASSQSGLPREVILARPIYALILRNRRSIRNWMVCFDFTKLAPSPVSWPSTSLLRTQCVPCMEGRPVASRGAGGARAPPLFGRSVNPISTRGGTLSPPSSTCHPGFSDLATALEGNDKNDEGD